MKCSWQVSVTPGLGPSGCLEVPWQPEDPHGEAVPAGPFPCCQLGPREQRRQGTRQGTKQGQEHPDPAGHTDSTGAGDTRWGRRRCAHRRPEKLLIPRPTLKPEPGWLEQSQPTPVWPHLRAGRWVRGNSAAAEPTMVEHLRGSAELWSWAGTWP